MDHTQNDQADVSEVSGGGRFGERTLFLNQTACRMRMLIGRLKSNFVQIDTVYQRVSLDGLARECSTLVSEAALQLEALEGLCWSAINDECDEGFQLSLDEWGSVASAPPAWLRKIFEKAVILSSMPDEEAIAQIGQNNLVLVLRAPDLRGDGLLPQFAAIMPKGIDRIATQIWWPWVMGGETPVVVEETGQDNVLREVSGTGFLQMVPEVDQLVPN